MTTSPDQYPSEPTPVEGPAPRHTLVVPNTWPHYDGPLHGLLEFQQARCAICSTPAEWGEEEAGVSACSLKQWVTSDLLLGLVCARCSRRYKTLNKAPQGVAVSGLRRFLANPPGQRCSATAGLGHQSRPRRFNSRLAPTEVPSPTTWTYSNTVIHSLFLWQRGRCAVCSTGLSVSSRPRYVHVDHDDTTGLIRGLLCQRCNICLGQNWQRSWWEHHEPTVDAYLAFPPAQVCPATRGLTMAERKRPAVLAWSTDRQEILLDGMPQGIAKSPESQEPTDRWYAVRYQETAPPGLPPALQANLVMPYSDDDGDWLAFVMDPPVDSVHQQRQCILRVRTEDTLAVTEHASLQEALVAAFSDAA